MISFLTFSVVTPLKRPNAAQTFANAPAIGIRRIFGIQAVSALPQNSSDSHFGQNLNAS
jgi:hypothetical protein